MNERTWKQGAGRWSALAALATLILLVGGLIVGNNNGSATGANPSPSASADCWKVVVTSGGAGDRVIAAGVKGTPQQVTAALLKAAQHDPAALVGLYNMSPLAKASGSLTVKEVAAAGCYTDTGKAAWYALAKEVNTSKTSNGTAPATGCNTFVRGGNVSYKCGPITGNRAGTMIVWSDGSVTWILHRCANPVTPTPPPPPKPNPTPTPTPSPSCTKPPVPGPGSYTYNPSDCTWHKNPTSWDCQQNGGPSCPPNGAVQPPQHNPGQPTGPSGPTQEPSPAPTATGTPPPNSGGYDGGSSGAPGPTPSNSPSTDPSAIPTGTPTTMPPKPV